MASLSYATSGTGPTAGGIGWIDFSSYYFFPGAAYDISANFRDGSSISFNIRCTSFSNGGVNFSATSPPISGSEFGSSGYNGISGNTVLASDIRSGNAGSNLRLTNITVKDKFGNTASNFTLFGCDAGLTDSGKTMFWYSNGTPWTLFATIGSTTSPSVSGLGGDSVTLSGVGPNPGCNILSSQNPSEVLVRCEVPSGTSMALSIGFTINSILLNKLIPIRRNALDQFELSVSGTPTVTTITSGVRNGVQSQMAQVFATIGNSYTINENMALASIGTLLDYNTQVYLSNLTPGGTSVSSIGYLGQSLTPALGDIFLATIVNTPITIPDVASSWFANTGSGPIAGGIRWIELFSPFNDPFTLSMGTTITNQVISFDDGTTMSFDVGCSRVSGSGVDFVLSQPPVQPNAGFGTLGYTGINKNVVFYSSTPSSDSSSIVTFSNISFRDSSGNPASAYTFAAGDAETTESGEYIIFITNGEPWSKLTTLGSTSSPSVSGVGTSTVTLMGTSGSPGDNIFTTSNPTQVSIQLGVKSGAKQGFVVGAYITTVKLNKAIEGRISPTDQFVLSLSGATTVTTGTLPNIQSQFVQSYTTISNSYIVNESMAPGSLTPLNQYSPYIVWQNYTSGGTTVPSSHSLGTSVTIAPGDIVISGILNRYGIGDGLIATKSVNKSTASIGDTLNYTIGIQNTSLSLTANNLFFIDTIPIGATFNTGSVNINNVPYPLLNPSPPGFAITIPSGISPNSLLTINYSVSVSSQTTINPIVNSAFIYGDYFSGIIPETIPQYVQTNTVTVPTFQANLSSVNVAILNSNYANCGDILTFNVTIPNAGNLTALNVRVIDTIPSGLSFMPNSVKVNGISVPGASPYPPDGILIGTIPPGISTNISYDLLIIC